MKRLTPGFLAVAITAASVCAAADITCRVPVALVRGQMMITAQLNGMGPYSFLLDTGYSMTMLRRDLAETLNLERGRDITVEGIAGEERAPTYQGARLDLGDCPYIPFRVGAMPATRRRRDGIVGAGLFRQYVVAVDLARKELSLSSPTNFTYSGKGEVVPLRFRRSTPIIEARIKGTNGEPVTGLFEVDTGCDSGICLSHDFTEANHLLESGSTRPGGKYGVGGGASTRSGRVGQLKIGALTIEQPETDFFLEGSPVDRGLAGHIGMEVLKNFRIWFDYGNRRMILER